MKINLTIAENIANKCFEKAKKINIPMSIAIIGNDGQLVHFKRMDGALPISIELAPAKAYTAYSLRMTTEKLKTLTKPGEMLYGLDTSCENIVIFGGGIPIKFNNEVIGAIGVSGGSVQEDIKVAEFGVKFFENRYTTN